MWTSARPRILVIGAGVSGLVTATALAARGARIVLAERPEVSTRASHFAGGMLAPWCEAATASPDIATMGAAAPSWWLRHFKGTRQAGSLVLAPRRDSAELQTFARRASHFRTLDAEGIAALEKDLAGRFSRALFFPDEAHLDPRAALASLTAALVAGGADHYRGNAEELDRQDFDHVVDCRGFGAAAALPELRGVRGEMLVLRCPDIALSRPVRLLHPRIPLYIVPRGDGIFMIGATMIESANRGAITARSTMELLNAAYTVHPAFGEAEILETGTNIRPAFPDNMPRISWEGRTIHVNGMHRHGFLLSPLLAERVAGMIFSEKDNLLESQP